MLTQFPNSIQAGLSLRVIVTAPEFPASAWQARAYLRGPSTINLVAAADGESHLFYQCFADTQDWVSGLYDYSVKVFNERDAFEIERGQVTVVVDRALISSTYDARNHEQRVLEAIEAVIEKRATKDQESYTINGRTLTRTPIEELLKLRSHYRAEIAQMKRGGRGKRLAGRQLKVRF